MHPPQKPLYRQGAATRSWEGLEDLHHPRFGEVFLPAGDLDQSPVARHGLVHEDRHPVDPGDAPAPECQAVISVSTMGCFLLRISGVD